MDRSGDFVDSPTSIDVQLWTIFATSLRPGPPTLDLYQPKWLPYHPGTNAASAISAISGWWTSKSGAVTPGAQLDEVIAGTNRPPPLKLGEAATVRVPAGGQELARLQAEQEASAAKTAQQPGYGSMFSGAYNSVTKAATSSTNQAARNLDLAQQRGELINSLEQGMSSLERNASEFSKNLKNQAMKSAVRNKFSEYF